MKPDDHLPVMTWHARPDMSCEYVNKAWLEYTGYTLAQALGEGWVRCLHPDDLGRWLEAAVLAFDERTPFQAEYRLRRRDGEYRWVLDRAAPRYGAGGLFVGFGGAAVDIDELKREQHSLARALERERRLRVATEEASRVRQALTVSVLQELHVPAQAIATWAAHSREQGAQAEALRAIERSARAQSRVIANLLQLEEQAPAPRPEGPLLSGVRVLLVGEKELIQPLQAAGAEVRTAASLAEALEAVNAWRPDVLVSEGDEALIRALRALPAERGGCLRAAALTDARSALAAGFDARLARPVEPVALLATVARLAA